MSKPDEALLRLAEHAAGLDVADLSNDALDRTKVFVLDTLACGLAGSRGPHADQVRDVAAGWGTGGSACAWGTRHHLPAAAAAMVNAYQIHCLEFDCVHEPSVLHPMSSLLAALVSDMQARGEGSGGDLVAAAAAGIDVTCTIGAACSDAMRFFRPSLLGAFGATAAVARARGFSTDQTAGAIGMLYGMISGTLQAHVEGSPQLGLQVGFAARNAIVACDLAERNIPAPGEIFTGRYGLFALYEAAADWSGAWDELRPGGRMLELSHKPFPSGRLTHYVIDALIQLRETHSLSANNVQAITTRVPPLVERLVGRPDRADADPNYLKLSIPYVAAVTVLRGTVDQHDFAEERMRDPRVHALASRIDVTSFDAPPNAFGPVHVEVEMRDGSKIRQSVEFGIGHPKNPLSRDQQEAKFWRCWRDVSPAMEGSRGEKLLERLWQLETESDTRPIFQALMQDRMESHEP